MKYLIGRASFISNMFCREAPCKNAHQEQVEHTETGWIADATQSDGCRWGEITTTRQAWFIEIDSLDQLLDFVKREGQCVIAEYETSISPQTPVIIIYDYYLE